MSSPQMDSDVTLLQWESRTADPAGTEASHHCLGMDTIIIVWVRTKPDIRMRNVHKYPCRLWSC